MKIPVIIATKLWHLGTLDKSQKGIRGASYEGNLLSASACPEAWMRICKLGGSQAHELNKHAFLLDMLEITDPKTAKGCELRDRFIKEALADGSIQQRTVFRASFFDDEYDELMYTIHETREEAIQEYDEDVDIEEVSKYFSSPDIIALHSKAEGDDCGLDFAIIEWAKKYDLDGVYWSQRLAPETLSAPRAGLFDRTIKSFKAVSSIPEDDEGLSHIGETQWVTIKKKREKDYSQNPSL